YTGPRTVREGKAVELKAKLLTATGKPVVGRLISFALSRGTRKQTCASKATTVSGVGECSLPKVTVGAGQAVVQARFGGDKRGANFDYKPSSSTTMVAVKS